VNAKPKLGFIAIAKKNHYKEEVRELLALYRHKLAQEPGIEAVVEAEVMFDEAAIAARARQMECQGADAVVLVVGTWIFSSVVISAVNDLNIPFVLWGLSDKVANGNLGASLQIRYVLGEMGKRFLYLCGPIRDEGNYRRILQYARAAWAKARMRNRRLATIGGKCMMMYQTQVNEFDWKRVFGVDFPQYDAVQVFKEMETIDEAQARQVAEAFLKRIDKVNWIAPNGEAMAKDAVLSQARMYLAFKRLQKLYDIDFFANKCMPEMSAIPYGYGYAACLATCMLNEDGIITACEADLPAAVSMYVLSLLTGQKVFFADIARLNKATGKLTFFNCGTAPISMADRSKGVELWPIMGNIADEALPEEYFVGKMKGACISFVLENGRPVTLLRAGGNGDTLRFHVASATTAPREIENEADIGNRWPGFGLLFKGDVEQFLSNTTGHHYSVVYGDCVDELRFLAGLLGIKFVYDC